MSQQNHSSSIPWQVIIPIILAIIFIPITIHFVEFQNEEDEARMKKWHEDQARERQKIEQWKISFKNLSCDEMRNKIYNEDLPLTWLGWAKETYKWKPCNEVILP